MSKYLRFDLDLSASGKTAVVSVHSAQHGDKLGEIRWFGRWRQYAFFPENGTIWNPSCLASVSEYIAKLMLLRKQEVNR